MCMWLGAYGRRWNLAFLHPKLKLELSNPKFELSLMLYCSATL